MLRDRLCSLLFILIPSPSLGRQCICKMSNVSKSSLTSQQKRGLGGRKKFPLLAKKLAEGEMPSKAEQKTAIAARKTKTASKRQQLTDEEMSKNKKNGEEPSRGCSSLKEMPSATNLTKNKKNDNTLKGGKAISKEINAVVDEYVANCDYKSIEETHAALVKMLPDPNEYQKFSQNKERNQSEQIPCLDETRFVLEPKEDEKDSNDYINASNVKIEGANQNYIISQAPLKNTTEDFWRMVFQAQSSAIVVICLCFEDGKEASEQFWPHATGEYKYYGKMFINNKKTEHTGNGSIYTTEVLPDGCSNSLVTKIYHFPAWAANSTMENHRRMILRFMRSIKMEGGPLTVVSNEGIGRACAYVLIDAITTRVFKGVPTKLIDVATAIRKQRALALNDRQVFHTAAQIIFDYIRVKIPKHDPAYNKLLKEYAANL